jgi:hypothetical protein
LQGRWPSGRYIANTVLAVVVRMETKVVRLNEIRGDLVEAIADAGPSFSILWGRAEPVSCFIIRLVKRRMFATT